MLNTRLGFSPLTDQLIKSLAKLPGIGPKTAQRLTFHLLNDASREKGLHLAHALGQALTAVGRCQRCHLYTEEVLCDICRDPKRQEEVLCVVTSQTDLVAIEQTGAYQGLYHLLKGHLSPLDGVGPAEIGVAELFHRLQVEPIQEVIIATNSTAEGRATVHYLASHIDPHRIKCTRIAYGVPMGGELEYLDAHTLSYAFKSRTLIAEEVL